MWLVSCLWLHGGFLCILIVEWNIKMKSNLLLWCVFSVILIHFPGFYKNICDKEKDSVMIIHAQEYPTIPAAPYPCKYFIIIIIIIINFIQVSKLLANYK